MHVVGLWSGVAGTHVSPVRDGRVFPGGQLDLGDTLEVAAEREIREEVGLTVTSYADWRPCAYHSVRVILRWFYFSFSG